MQDDDIYAVPEMITVHEQFAYQEQQIAEEILSLIRAIRDMDEGGNLALYSDLLRISTNLVEEFGMKKSKIRNMCDLLRETHAQASEILTEAIESLIGLRER